MNLLTGRVTPAELPQIRLVALALVGLLGAAGCGGTSTKGTVSQEPSTSASPPAGASATPATSSSLSGVDSCTLLTPADFSAATTAVLSSQYPTSTYTIRTVATKTDVGPAVDQHSACTYHFSGNPGTTGEITLDVMTAAEYKTLATYETPKPISGLGDEAGVYGTRPAVLKGSHGALIANSSGSIAFATALLRSLEPRL